ncbi:tRNA (adenosine(37)-N6)-dimethylallyltransferase MiaA [Fimbriiglobus ruber]|uniref:tRNA dimethylallyltransferase n=1 Tax=Fimbriiglobus ruber TaxID=1908690 RepID=A0A225DQ84_9BACT|nr:tRNA (adenosine(37)-N6)-dimethylallyltransferase MiaA [Fimbriiglobus ruber]OWK43542.1 tRNA dimethylallyltransferase [Fimbriiglobus ruber]
MPPPPTAFADALILTGPTGSGKSAVALELAEQMGCEIVALDSMTLYRGMDIGTAKPTREEMARVPHHLVDVLDPWESGSIAWWLDRAAEACAAIRARGRRPLFVGGTPFYLKALLCGLFDAPPVDPAVRRALEEEAERIGKGALHERLASIDPKTAARLHPNDVRRVVRALEVFETTGRPISSFQQTWDTPAFASGESPSPVPLPCVAIEWPREVLYQRIDARVIAMLDAGWLDEVRRLRELPRPLSKEAAQALGYRELTTFLDGASGWPETVALIQMRTRQFAKRQLTWFRSLPGCRPCPADLPGLADRVREMWAIAP